MGGIGEYADGRVGLGVHEIADGVVDDGFADAADFQDAEVDEIGEIESVSQVGHDVLGEHVLEFVGDAWHADDYTAVAFYDESGGSASGVVDGLAALGHVGLFSVIVSYC